MMKISPVKLSCLAACLFGLSACSTLEHLDRMAGELLAALDQPVADLSLPSEDTAAGSSTPADYRELTRIQKKDIDEWLSAHGFNRYGDAEGTMYAGGTPLVDEGSGESVNRFDYILRQIPDIVDKIGR